MTINVKMIADAINELLFNWARAGLILDSRTHKGYRRSNGEVEITWGDDGFILTDNNFSTLSEYCALLESRQYSMLLQDGSIFQISFTIKRDRIVKHRLCWYPCPVALSAEVSDADEIISIILGLMASGAIDNFLSKTPLRFDFSPDDAAEHHPVTHLHLMHEDCRIPVKSPLCLKQFMTFIVENFYKDIQEFDVLYKAAKSWPGGDTLTAGQRGRFHLNIL